MSLLDSLRKGLDLLLLSFGVSTPTRKPQPAPKPASQPIPAKPEGPESGADKS